MRALVRRDRNCPSVILWSIGNEVGEQFTDAGGAALARKLNDIVHDEDPTRPTTTAMNVARATSAFAAAVDVVGLNYQGAGIRGAPGQYPAFHQALPNKLIASSETASALSSRGEYVFPVASGFGAAVGPKAGEDPIKHHVSAYELYYAAFGAAPDKVFASQEQHPFLARRSGRDRRYRQRRSDELRIFPIERAERFQRSVPGDCPRESGSGGNDHLEGGIRGPATRFCTIDNVASSVVESTDRSGDGPTYSWSHDGALCGLEEGPGTGVGFPTRLAPAAPFFLSVRKAG